MEEKVVQQLVAGFQWANAFQALFHKLQPPLQAPNPIRGRAPHHSPKSVCRDSQCASNFVNRFGELTNTHHSISGASEGKKTAPVCGKGLGRLLRPGLICLKTAPAATLSEAALPDSPARSSTAAIRLAICDSTGSPFSQASFTKELLKESSRRCAQESSFWQEKRISCKQSPCKNSPTSHQP